MPSLSGKIIGFRRMIWNHYRRHGRDLPWRRTRDPYRILVSEMMLQQTQVERVIAKYASFLQRFPDIASLAQAPLPDVLRAWQGLGYNRRALYLWQTAQIISRRNRNDPSLASIMIQAKLGSPVYSGSIPSRPKLLTRLPGIGPATAGAIAAFAFQKPVAFIETNIRRVFLHFFFPKSTGVADAQILPLISRTMSRKNPRKWYYALMDYGALLGEKQKGAHNPNRRSRHYGVQPRFAGSRRQLRGKILTACLTDPSLSLPALASRLGIHRTKIKVIYAALKKEGLIA